ncbi:MAG: sugar kinase [Candidatus Aenigmarchaeota archaeon]|nr:sugar kinase [Candidatus Aenigmarchaeota archaeon]
MPKLVVFGSVAFDSIRTPFGEANEVLGGAAVYASVAASFFTHAGIVSGIGKDFPKEWTELLRKRNISTEGLKIAGEKTFRWKGYYEYDMASAHTVSTELNVMEGLMPELPGSYRKAPYVFLANLHPEQQLHVLDQMDNPRLSILDTMNYWITNEKEKLMNLIKKIDILLLNDAEARQLFSTPNLIAAGRRALAYGPGACIIKKGEHGVLLFTEKEIFSLPGYPLETVRDPTGAGDSFAGGLAGFLAKAGAMDEKALRKAMVYGSAIASYTVEGFGLDRLRSLTNPDIQQRYKEFEKIVRF